MDFTFNNDLIKKYFEGDDSYVPVGELMWLHEHPLVTPNFLTELEDLILEAGKTIVEFKIGSHMAVQLEDIAIEIGQYLPTITYATAPGLLSSLRKAYVLSKELKKLKV